MVLLIEAVRAARRRTTGTSSVERVVPSSAPLPATQLALLCAGRESGRVQLNALWTPLGLVGALGAVAVQPVVVGLRAELELAMLPNLVEAHPSAQAENLQPNLATTIAALWTPLGLVGVLGIVAVDPVVAGLRAELELAMLPNVKEALPSAQAQDLQHNLATTMPVWWSWWEDQDVMRETSLLVDNLSVMMNTMSKMLLWFAGVWGTLLVKPLLILSLDQSLAPLRWTMCGARATKLPSKNALILQRITVVPLMEQASSAQSCWSL